MGAFLWLCVWDGGVAVDTSTTDVFVTVAAMPGIHGFQGGCAGQHGFMGGMASPHGFQGGAEGIHGYRGGMAAPHGFQGGQTARG